MSQKSVRGLSADAGGCLQRGGLGAEVFFLGDEVLDLQIDLLNGDGQPLDAAFDFRGHALIEAGPLAVLFTCPVLDELGSPIGQRPQLPRGGRSLLGRGRLSGLTESSDDGGVDRIGLREDL
ncbi:MAG: hypothetical protein U0929_11290 [Planctomycetaceae bacterium]